MTGDKTLMMGVLYPGLDRYLPDYISSLKSQSDLDFDILILNDHADSALRKMFPLRTTWMDVTERLSFGAIRMLGINYALANQYDYLIFTDLDDFFSSNRVASTKHCLSLCDFTFSELQLISQDNSVISDHYLNKIGVNRNPADIHEVVNANIFGLSHTAIRTRTLATSFYIPEELDVVDWWIFSILLLQHYRGCFQPDTLTYYRQSDNNYVGIGKPLDETRLKRGIHVKALHYKHLQKYCRKFHFEPEARLFSDSYSAMKLLDAKIADPLFMNKYIAVINRNFGTIYHGWWSEILSLDEWSKYE